MARERQRVRLVRDGVTQSLTEIVSDLPKVENRAMREGAKFFAEKLEQNTPVGPDPRPPNKYGPNTPYSTTRLKEDVKWQKRGQGRYVVGYGTDTAWRAVFVNNGTIHITPQFFFEKTVDQYSKDVNKIVEDVVREELMKKR